MKFFPENASKICPVQFSNYANHSYQNLASSPPTLRDKMDILYATRCNSKLFAWYQDKDDVQQRGCRIWGFRLLQMLLNLGAFIAALIAALEIVHQHVLPHWKLFLWAALLGLQVILSVSGIVLYILARKAPSFEAWALWSGIYNMFQSHFLVYAWVLGCHDVFYSKRYKLVDSDLFDATVAASVLCFLSSIIHFLSALFPTPFPPFLRLQSEQLDAQSESKVWAEESSANATVTATTTAAVTNANAASAPATAVSSATVAQQPFGPQRHVFLE